MLQNCWAVHAMVLTLHQFRLLPYCYLIALDQVLKRGITFITQSHRILAGHPAFFCTLTIHLFIDSKLVKTVLAKRLISGSCSSSRGLCKTLGSCKEGR